MKAQTILNIIILLSISSSDAMLNIRHQTPHMQSPIFIEKQKSKLDTLPLELQGHIIKKLFYLHLIEDQEFMENNHIENKEHCASIPVELGIRHIHNFFELKKLTQQLIFNKKFNTRDLYEISLTDRKQMLDLDKSHKSFWSQAEKDNLKLIEQLPNDIKNGITLFISPKSKFAYFLEKIFIRSSLFSFALALPTFFSFAIVDIFAPKAIKYAAPLIYAEILSLSIALTSFLPLMSYSSKDWSIKKITFTQTGYQKEYLS